jgi:hypothetical protein
MVRTCQADALAAHCVSAAHKSAVSAARMVCPQQCTSLGAPENAAEKICQQ